MNLSELIDAAIEHQRAGRLQKAAELFQQALGLDPRNLDALHLLGVIAYQSGQDVVAVELLQKAIEVDPNHAIIHNTLGLAHHRLGDVSLAEASFLKAVDLAPDSAQPLNNLGNLYRDLGRQTKAIACFEKAIAFDPQHLAAWFNLGNVQWAQRNLNEAVRCFEQAIALAPKLADAHRSLGEVLLQLNRPGDAVGPLRTATEFAEDDHLAFGLLGRSLLIVNRPVEAQPAFERAVELSPGDGQSWYGLACSLTAQEEHADSISAYRKVLSIDPHHVESHHNLGRALFETGFVDEAIDQFRAGLLPRFEGLSLGSIATIIPGAPRATNQDILAARKAWAFGFARPAAEPFRFDHLDRNPDRRLRIGYVSSFFQNRNWMKPVWGLINQHDRDQFELHLLSDGAESLIDFGYRRQPRDRFHDISALSNDEVAALIHDRQIDLLVDLNAFSRLGRLPLYALKPAPVIAAWFNMFGPSGMSAFDYLIGDEHVIPREEEPFYTEQIVRLPQSYLTFDVDYPVPDVVPPPSVENGAITFGSLCSMHKITPHVVRVWSQILERVPESQLIVRNSALASRGNRALLRRRFADHGIADTRLQVTGPAEHFSFLQTYNDIDIALDTFPYNGGTTTMEALWQGAPVLSFHGDRWASRTSESLLRSAGLDEYVARNADDYIRRAVQLATDPDTPGRLAELRSSLRQRLEQSPICDTSGLAAAMEAAYRKMWHHYCGRRA